MMRLAGLEKRFGAFTLGPLDLRVDAEVVAVLGPSGCGKTTLLSLIAGLLVPDAGSITLGETTLMGRPPNKRGIGFVFQDGALFPHMTARENIAYAAADSGRVQRLTDRLEITSILDQPAPTLSGGEAQRVALARSLAADPDALLLDEPLSDLDAPIKRRLRDELRLFLTSLDIPVLYVTHNQNQASIIGDRVAVMDNGTIEQVATPDEVFKRPATRFVAAFTGSENLFRGRVDRAGDDTRIEWGPHRLAITGAESSDSAADGAWFCIRPEYVRLDAAGAHFETPNQLEGVVDQARFTSHAYRVGVRVSGTDDALQVIVPPARYEALDLGVGASVTVGLPADALHVIPAGDSPTGG